MRSLPTLDPYVFLVWTNTRQDFLTEDRRPFVHAKPVATEFSDLIMPGDHAELSLNQTEIVAYLRPKPVSGKVKKTKKDLN